MAYDFTTDPTAFLVIDDRSTFYQDTAKTTPATTAGQTVQAALDVSALGNHYNPTQGGGTVTLGVRNGFKYLVGNGSSYLTIPTSTGFDNQFLTTGNTGGWSALVIVSSNTNEGFITNKSNTNSTLSSLSIFDGPFFQTFNSPVCYRRAYDLTNKPIVGFGVVAENGTTGTGMTAGYRDGASLYLNGAQSVKANAGTLTETAGFPLNIFGGTGGSYKFNGNIYALVMWNRSIKPHEMLAAYRYYAARYGLAESLTNQPFALIVDANSETTNPQSFTEMGAIDQACLSLGLGTDGCFMQGRGGRKQAEINYDFTTWTLPLIQYLQSLGVPVVVFNWEGINDTSAANWLAYSTQLQALTTGVQYCSGTVFATSGNTPSYATATPNTRSVYNYAIMPLASQYGIPLAALGTNATLSTYNAALYSDGLHWNSAGIMYGVPDIARAIAQAYSRFKFAPPSLG